LRNPGLQRLQASGDARQKIVPARADSATKTIEFIPSSNATPHFLREYDGVKKEAAKYGYHTLFQAPSVSLDVSKQIGMVYTAITRGVNGIILVPYSPTARRPRQAQEAASPSWACPETYTSRDENSGVSLT
jgi:ABC-type sugar transport system substrate-binding protein